MHMFDHTLSCGALTEHSLWTTHEKHIARVIKRSKEIREEVLLAGHLHPSMMTLRMRPPARDIVMIYAGHIVKRLARKAELS